MTSVGTGDEPSRCFGRPASARGRPLPGLLQPVLEAPAICLVSGRMRGTEGVTSLYEVKAVSAPAPRLWVTQRPTALTE